MAKQKKPEHENFHEAEWNGLPNYICDNCGYATTNHALMLEHQRRYLQPEPPKQLPTPFYDRFGNQLMKENREEVK